MAAELAPQLRRALPPRAGRPPDAAPDPRESGGQRGGQPGGPAGRRSVTVTTERRGTAAGSVSGDGGRHRARDDPRASWSSAFDDFYTTKAGGTGLGLSIVRRLVLDLGRRASDRDRARRRHPRRRRAARASGQRRRRDDAGARRGRRAGDGRAVRLRPQAHSAATRCSPRGDGRRGAGAARRRRGGLRHPRSRDAGHGRLRGAARAGAAGDRGAGHRLHRHRQLRPLHPGGAARRLRLHRQGRADGAGGPGDRERDRAAAAARGGGRASAPARTARRSLVGAQRRRWRGSARQIARVAPMPSTVLVVGRERDGQGAGGARSPPARAAARRAVRRHQLRGAAREPGRERALRPRARRVHRRRQSPGRARSSRRSAARSFSTRSASCRSRRRPSCCACSRSGRSPGSAARGRFGRGARRRGHQPRPRGGGRGRAASAQDSTTGSTCTSCGCRRCATGCPTSRSSSSVSSPAICARFGMRQKKLAAEPLELLMALRVAAEQRARAAERGRADDHRGGRRGDRGRSMCRPRSGTSAVAGAAADGDRSFQELKAEAERRIVVAALERNEWHVTRTAEALGLADHASLLKIMRRHGDSASASGRVPRTQQPIPDPCPCGTQ